MNAKKVISAKDVAHLRSNLLNTTLFDVLFIFTEIATEIDNSVLVFLEGWSLLEVSSFASNFVAKYSQI